jgi:WD40 repeat protein
MRVLPGPTKSNTTLAWSPDGRFLAAGGTGDGVTVWEVDSGKPGGRVLTAGHGGENLQFCAANGLLFVAFRNGGVWTYAPETGEECLRLPNDDRVAHASVSMSGSVAVLCRTRTTRGRTASTSVVGFVIEDGGELREVWSRPDDAPHGGRFDFTLGPGEGQLFGLYGQWFRESEFRRVDAAGGGLIGSLLLPSDRGRVTRWALAPEGERVAWLTDRGLFLCRLDAPETRLELPAADGEVRRGLAFHPNGRMLAYSTGNTVRLLDADTLSEIRAHDWNTGKARAVCFSPDGLRCAASGEGGRGWVTVFDVE